MTASYHDIKDQLLDASLDHVPFDGWSEATFRAAVSDAGIDPTMAKAVCPRGAVDLAIAYHHRGDALMLERLKAADLTEMRFRDRIATAVRFRLEVNTNLFSTRVSLHFRHIRDLPGDAFR